MTVKELYKAIRTNAKSKLTSRRGDWRIDRMMLRDLNTITSTREFVHTTSDSNTQLYPVYANDLDTVRPYLFSACTPRKTLNDMLVIFSPSRDYFDDAIIQHFDGKRLRVIDKAKAHEIFRAAALRKSLPRAA